MMVQNWYLVTVQALLGLWEGFLAFLPKMLGALIVFLVGWFFAAGIGRLVTELLNRLKLNQVFKRTGWDEALEKAELKVNISEFLGAIVKWVLVLAFLVAAVKILEIREFSDLLTDVLGYLPNIVVSVLIFVVTVILADILEKITVASIERAKIAYSRLAGLIVKGSIWYFAISAILLQLKIFPEELITSLFSGIIALVVISFGLAFGLGGKEIATEVLRDLREKFRR